MKKGLTYIPAGTKIGNKTILAVPSSGPGRSTNYLTRCDCGKVVYSHAHGLLNPRGYRMCRTCFFKKKWDEKVGTEKNGLLFRGKSEKFFVLECLICGATKRYKINDYIYLTKNDRVAKGCVKCGYKNARKGKRGSNVARISEVRGVSKKQIEWARFLGLTRERVRQLANEGLLASRIEKEMDLRKKLGIVD